ncbi:MAG TPA: histidinol dehydrogenase [Actinomycetes bacterium]|nr:histidinol dehydrogenase [Actinomycetes bacterium]
MRIIRYPEQAEEIRQISTRTAADIAAVRQDVREILEDVRRRGDAAIVDYHRRYDGVELSPEDLRVPVQSLRDSLGSVPEHLLEALRARADNLRALHCEQSIQPARVELDGITAGELVRPVTSAGLYIPGGTAPFPTVMQTLGMAAAIAGVPRVVACIPPSGVTDEVLAAAYLSRVTELYRVGGVAAIAALAYGTGSIAPVHLVAGPGNLYVTAAKMEVYGTVAIDMPAGPSEAVIICEPSADPQWVAVDVLARAEHDPRSAGVVVTWSQELADAVRRVTRDLAPTFERRDIIAESLDRFSAIVVTRDKGDAIAFANQYAPEHLEILADDAEDYLPYITHAGSVFLGHHTPVAVGDYLGISNHILPTSGYARSFSPVSIRTFQRVIQFERISAAALGEQARRIMLPLAEAEGLGAHAESLQVRLRADGSPSADEHAAASRRRRRRPAGLRRKFGLGVYFDLYSAEVSDWTREAEFNRRFRPDVVEILLEYPGTTADLTQERADMLRALIGVPALTVHAPTITLSLASMNRLVVEATQRELTDALDATRRLGARMMTIHVGEYPFYASLNGTDPASLFTDNVGSLLDDAAKSGVTLCVENLSGDNVYPHTLEDVRRLLKQSPGLMLAHDMRHFCNNGIDPLHAFAEFADRTGSIHFRIDCGLDEEQLHRFLEGILRHGYSGNFVIEDRALVIADKTDKTQLLQGFVLVQDILADLCGRGGS